jgi:hypothetical protein
MVREPHYEREGTLSVERHRRLPLVLSLSKDERNRVEAGSGRFANRPYSSSPVAALVLPSFS